MRLPNIVCKFLIFCLIFLASSTMSASAAGLWSEDLWSEPAQEKQPQTICWSCQTDWWSNEPTQGQGSSANSGLWSEDLWAPVPNENQPVEQPKEKPKEPNVKVPPEQKEEPGETEPGTTILSPTESEPPPSDEQQSEIVEVIRMQIANHQAYVRGVATQLSVPPTMINDRTMVPLRFIGEALGAELSWSQAEQKITMQLHESNLQLWLKKSTATVNGQVVHLDTPPVILNGSTLVPLKFVSEQIGYGVTYDNATKTVTITETISQQAASQKEESKEEPREQKEVVVPDVKPEEAPPKTIPESSYDYIGTWQLLSLPSTGGLPMGNLAINEDGTYFFNHGIYKGAIGHWRAGEKDEVIGHQEMLILEDGPGDVDWVLIPKQEGMVSVRYQHGYTGTIKVWLEDSYGIKMEK